MAAAAGEEASDGNERERGGGVAAMEPQNFSSPCLRVAMESYIPFTDFTRTPTPHNFHGIMLQVLAIIAKKLNVCMEYQVPQSHFFGRRLGNGTWTGLLGMLMRREVDMGGTPMTVSDERFHAMDPSVPLYMDVQTLAYKRPVLESDLLGFIKPYTLEVWLLLGMALVVVAVSGFVIDGKYNKLLPLIHSSSHPVSTPTASSSSSSSAVIKRGTASRSSISLANVFHWAFGIFMGQSPEWRLRGFPSRMTAVVWIFMALIVSVVYRSNLKAMLIAPKLRLPFDSTEELLQTDVPFMVLEGSLMHRLYLSAEPGSILYRLRKQAVTPHQDAQRAAVEVTRGDYTVMTSGLGADYVFNMVYAMTKTCPLYLTRQPFFSAATLVIPYTRGFRLRHQMDSILQQLRDTGILGHLYSRPLTNATKCPRFPSLTDTGDSPRALDPGDFYGLFSVYAGGVFWAALVLVLEVALRPSPQLV